ncbi:MAG: IS66 family insertion sequence element accessory protein TnpB [Methylococcales bacterium]|nr:IS66 family insertion sequence element accessory protein TnpB [Methylococcales bacterium]
MRKQIDGLAIIAEEAMGLNPFANNLFVFCNRQRDKTKILHWDRNGFCLCYKRLEQDVFKWPKQFNQEQINISHESLLWLLDGVDIEQIKRHKSFEFDTVM